MALSERAFQYLRDVYRLTVRPVGDLVAAGCAVGDDEVLGCGGADGGAGGEARQTLPQSAGRGGEGDGEDDSDSGSDV